MSATTPRYQFQYPSSTDATDVPGNMETFLDEIDAIIECAYKDVFANRPTAGIFGRLFLATDQSRLYFDDGTNWNNFGYINSSAGNITTSTPGQSALAGSVGLAADAGHRHAREAWGTSSDIQPIGSSPGAGSTGRVADAGHVHPGASMGSLAFTLLNIAPGADYFLTNGQAISRATYGSFYTALGGESSPWGQGDGSTTFNVPNLMDRTVVGAGQSYSLAQLFGAAAVTLTTSQIPSHTHTILDPTHYHTGLTGVENSFHDHATDPNVMVHDPDSTLNIVTEAGSGASWGSTETSIEDSEHAHPFTTDAADTGVTAQQTGGGASHTNIQPSCGVYIWIKAA